ncbi:glycolate oxidase subunit GlcE [Thiohalocapsa marina]|uniref:Glycolate oxidase subunit GlcE n=1 Tax=Thiohalocapsa marina TaxID=424902 RepID=A0A5M8FHL7_9GAMM|nr:glycolate oxidase subunit GlcE [Thiohalocapsa marina]KAA6184383.1 glycolate oxidase subunit GlcE [Thiohalocapsa marina]
MTDISEHDAEQALIEQVLAAADAGTPLCIRGGGSKDFYGNPARASRTLDCATHRGVVAYEPSELAITVRAGTPLADVEALLQANGQQFPFEPPHFGPAATIGGMVAAGLSGPRRPYAASVRDAVLGVRLLNGRGQALGFGGRVMKNVAGYDLSRLMAGSLGVLGVLLEVSLKVSPAPVGRMTLVQEQSLSGALALMRRWARRSLPVTATAWSGGRLSVRICGSEDALAESHRLIGGLPLPDADRFWQDLREQRLDFFAGEAPLWRLSLPPATPLECLDAVCAGDDPGADQLVEWGGAQRWLRGDLPADGLRAAATAAGGHATLFRAGADQAAPAAIPVGGVFTPLQPVVLRLHRNLKQAFDPAGLFNPGRLYPEF